MTEEGLNRAHVRTGLEIVPGTLVVVTGGAKGIGRAIVQRLAAVGCRCAFTYLHSEHAASGLRDELTAMGLDVLAVQVDVRSPQAIDDLKARIAEHSWGPVGILVNNAGVIADAFLHKMDDATWHQVIDTNLTGTFNCCRAFVPEMRDQGSGAIINVASFVGLAGNLGQVNYVASKAGIIGMTKAMALELARCGMTVNAVAPGFIETDMVASIPEAVRAKLLERIPMRRFGTASDVAEAVAFLASPAARYITGQVLSMNGGIYL